MEFINPV